MKELEPVAPIEIREDQEVEKKQVFRQSKQRYNLSWWEIDVDTMKTERVKPTDIDVFLAQKRFVNFKVTNGKMYFEALNKYNAQRKFINWAQQMLKESKL